MTPKIGWVVGAFVGRTRELLSLERQLGRVKTAGADAPGKAVFVRGRRRVGKSRLIEEFCTQSGCAYVFFAASKAGPNELGLFAEEIAQSNLPGRALFAGSNPSTWDAALRLLAATLDPTAPTIVVFDEFPYLVDEDSGIEGTFQKHWDQLLSKKPVLLLLIGSDLAMMEALNTHSRPLYQRGVDMIVPPLSPVETAAIVGSPTADDSFDAYLLTGGLPLICNDWPSGLSMWDYLAAVLDEPTSPFIVSAERVLAAEFPVDAQARVVLGQIGAGEVTFSKIARAAGGLQKASANRSLELLLKKRIIAKDKPLSTTTSSDPRYRVADPYLRFWLRFIGPHMAEIERGRGDRVLDRIRGDWMAWRGRAIEPVIREALSRLSPIPGLPAAAEVGGFWTRSNNPEIDIIGADKGPVAGTIAYAGTIKWRDNQPLTQGDMNQLAHDVLAVSGANSDTPLLAVSRSGVTANGVLALGPDDLIAAW